MIHFFRDVLDGPIYIVLVIISIIIIMGIIGFIMERYQLAKENTSVVKDVKINQPQATSTLVLSSNQIEKTNQLLDSSPPKPPVQDPIPSMQNQTSLENIPNPMPLPTVEISNVKETAPVENVATVPTIVETPAVDIEQSQRKPAVLELNSSDILENQPVITTEEIKVPQVKENNVLSIQSTDLQNIEATASQPNDQGLPKAQTPTNVAPVIDFGSTSDVEVAPK